ncbi:MAG: lysylphosphatidylglycerol synthase transmembrane domain-containing protein [Chloroflexota bacterium]
MSGRLQSVIKILVALAALGIVVIALRGVDLQQALSILISANIAFLLLTVVFQAINLTVRLYRWKYLLLPTRDIPLGTLVSPLFIAFAVGNLAITGAGAVPRIYILNRRTGVDGGFIAGTLAQEAFLDAGAVILWAAIVPFVVDLPPAFRTVQALLILPLGLLFFIELAVWRRRSLLVDTLKRQGLWERVLGFLPALARENLDTFGHGLSDAFAQPKTLAAVVGSTLLIWITEAFIFWMLALSLTIPFSYLQASAVTAYTNAAIGIIVVPGFVGTLEASAVSLTLALGGTQAAALAYTVLLRVFVVGPSTLLGAFFAWREAADISK